MRRFRFSSFAGVLLTTLVVTGCCLALPVFAQADMTTEMETLAEIAGFSTTASIPVIIARLIRTFLSFMGVILVGYFLYGGSLWMMAAGEQAKIDKARRVLIHSVIGFVIIITSFAITQFIISALIDTGMVGGVTSGTPTDGGYPDAPSGSGSTFYLASENTACSEYVKNMQLQFGFSQRVDSQTVEDGGISIAVSGGDEVEGTFSVSGQTVTFTPDAECEESSDLYCFTPGTTYDVNLYDSVLESTTGRSLECSLTYPCSFSFTVGSDAGIDAESPDVSMNAPEDEATVYTDEAENLQALTEDDLGVTTVVFYVDDDDESVYDAGLSDSTEGVLSEENYFDTQGGGEFDASGYVTNEDYSVWAVGSDCAGNTDTSSRISITVRAASCHDGVHDSWEGDEADCGGDSSSELYCGACSGDSCEEDSDCTSGVCEDGTCVSVPKISRISPGDGAPGNLITVSGSGFGSETGNIGFLGTETGDESVTEAYLCNGVLSWSDDEIIVEVTEDAVDGPMIITTVDGDQDRTDDDYGSYISDFDVNAILRPGLCNVTPESTPPLDYVDVYGNSLGSERGNSVIYFDSYLSTAYTSWIETSVNAYVPNLDDGNYDVQAFTGDYFCKESGVICESDDDCDTTIAESCIIAWCSETLDFCETDDDCEEGSGTCESVRQGSNEIEMQVETSDSDTEPMISYIDSGWTACSDDGASCTTDDDCSSGTCDDALNWGPVGQTITIYGSDFGTAEGLVKFVSQASGETAYGDTDFPDVCEDNLWDDESVTIKVPEEFSGGSALTESSEYDIYLQRGDDSVWGTIGAEFYVVSGDPGPSICLLDPSSGPIETSITIYGDDFGSVDGSVEFYEEQILAAGEYTEWDTGSDYDIISGVIVPEETQSGPVFITRNDLATSNTLNFTIGDCNEDADLCSASEECCSDGSCSTGTCPYSDPEAHYAYSFTTATIPSSPEVYVSCSPEDSVVSPTPWERWGGSVCLSSVVSATFTESMKESTLVASNISVAKCLDEDCETIEEVSGAVSPTSLGFNWIPTDNWEVSSRYRVLLNGGEESGAIQSAEDGYLADDYEWYFETDVEGSDCEVGEIYVTPTPYSLTELYSEELGVGFVDYTAQLVSADNECVLISCDGHTTTWSPDTSATSELSGGTDADCESTFIANGETSSGNPAIITATTESVDNNPSADAELTIDLTDPEISSYSPDCATACINVLPILEFNTSMNESTVDIAIYECEDAQCTPDEITNLNTIMGVNIDPVEETNQYYISLSDNLEPNTNYRVVVSGDMESDSGVALSESGSNYVDPSTGDDDEENLYFEDDFSWIFTTKDSLIACEVTRIEVEPESPILNVIGQNQQFVATPYGQPDDCSELGQAVQPQDHDWEDWTATDNPDYDISGYLVASIDSLLIADDMPAWCSSCVRTGADATVSQGICGDGNVGLGEDCDDDNDTSGDGCSSICLNEGIEACEEGETESCCGNSVVDEFEECDDGGSGDGDGCSSVCLNEGSNYNCGNSDVDHSEEYGGEECDDGGSTNGDGCSSICLNEGSTSISSVTAVCGNGIVEDGEQCDEGDEADGDGCSSTCLFEGASVCVFECFDSGDNRVGTNCLSDADCATDSGHYCGTLSQPCCGDGIIDYSSLGIAQQEGCDEFDSVSGDGCSSTCLYEGSSIDYETPSLCGDGIHGTGEEAECEVGVSYTLENYAIATVDQGAPIEVNEEGYAISSIATAVGDIAGEAVLSVECSCEEDATCEDAETIGCGTNNCCFYRPVVGSTNPVGVDLCRNTAVWVEFDSVMDEATYDPSVDTDGSGAITGDEYIPNIYLEIISVAGVQVEDDSTACPSDAVSITVAQSENPFVRAWQWVKRKVMGFVGLSARAATTDGGCFVQIDSYTTTTTDDGVHVVINYADLLPADSEIKLVVLGDMDVEDAIDEGVLSAYAVGINGTSESALFGIGSELCEIDEVTVQDYGKTPLEAYELPSEGYFSEISEIHSFAATAYTYRSGVGLEEIQETASYAWDWSWGTTTSAGGTFDDVVVATSVDATSTEVVALGEDGTETVIATTTVTVNDLVTDYDATNPDVISGSYQVRALMCSNPWPSNDAYLYHEPTTNYSFYYCRDDGEDGEEDDLPALAFEIDVSSTSSDIFTEYIYRVEGENDAVGVRVLANETYMSPTRWFYAQGFTGVPSVTTFDGYEAVELDTTYYVAAANQAGDIYPNIYVISYNSGASTVSQEIFDQIVENWSFNANEEVSDVNICQNPEGDYILGTDGEYVSCSWDGDCREETCDAEQDTCELDVNGAMTCVLSGQSCVDTTDCGVCSLTGSYCASNNDCVLAGQNRSVCHAEKAKLTRDMDRLTDVDAFEQIVTAYGYSYAHCSATLAQSCVVDDDCPDEETCIAEVPGLSEGTFIPATSVSTWPSWSAELGNALGSSVPSDPINEFSICAQEGYEADYCWSGDAGVFSCAEGSHVYAYRSVASEEYTLFMQLEHAEAPWVYNIDQDSTDNFTVTVEYEGDYTGPDRTDSTGIADGFEYSPQMCGTENDWGESTTCGDGITSSAEVCEIGDVTTADCNVCMDTEGTTSTTCTTSSDCATGETCTAGLLNLNCFSEDDGAGGFVCAYETTETAASSCVPYTCGNGIVETENGEECDDGALNGSYGHCDEDCGLSMAFYCGDGYLAGGETCDCGNTSTYDTVIADSGSWAAINACETSNGQYSENISLSCNYDCTSPGPSCGDLELNGDETCDGDSEEWEGALCANGDMCSSDSDCSDGSVCGDGGDECPYSAICEDISLAGQACSTYTDCRYTKTFESGGYVLIGWTSCTSGYCESVADVGSSCSTNDDCNSGICGEYEYQLSRYRSCPDDCAWDTSGGDWSSCVAGDQVCGNGVLEGSEECDDGNTSNNDACTGQCRLNVCGDEYVYTGAESCDRGSENGQSCEAGYEGTCQYCTGQCEYMTRSGSYCGDGVINGSELCDGDDLTYRYFEETTRDVYGTCTEDELVDGTYYTDESGVVYTCNEVGVCNGGTDHGEFCTTSRFGELDDHADCPNGSCVAPSCSSDCGSTCPFSYETVSLQMTSETEGASRTGSLALYSYLNGDNPDVAVMHVPACSMASQFSADITLSGSATSADGTGSGSALSGSSDAVSKAAVMFVIDISESMDLADEGDETGDGVATDAYNYLEELVPAVYEYYSDRGIDLEMGLISSSFVYAPGVYTGGSMSGSRACNEPDSYGDNDGASVEAYLTLVATDDDSGYSLSTAERHIFDNGIDEVFACAQSEDALYQGLDLAMEEFAAESDADVNVIYLLTAGDPQYFDYDLVSLEECSYMLPCESGACWAYSTGASACIWNVKDLKEANEDVVINTITFSDDTTTQARMAHVSSESCDWDSTADYDDCNHGTYALVYSDIKDEDAGDVVEGTLDAAVGDIEWTWIAEGSDGSTEVTTMDMDSGEGSIIPFPDGFACSEDEQTITFRAELADSWVMSISDAQMEYCPVGTYTEAGSEVADTDETEDEDEVEEEEEEEVIESDGSCGNDIVDTGEYCDGSAETYYCFNSDGDPEARDLAYKGSAYVTCASLSFDSWINFTSSQIGICSGGTMVSGTETYSYEGVPCAIGSTAYTTSCGVTDSSAGTTEGTCVATACETDCSTNTLNDWIQTYSLHTTDASGISEFAAVCGDGDISSGEYCEEGDLPYYCFVGAHNPADRVLEYCAENYIDCDCEALGYESHQSIPGDELGVCDGGDEYVADDDTIYSYNGYVCDTGGTSSSSYYMCGERNTTYGTYLGTCVPNECGDDCTDDLATEAYSSLGRVYGPTRY
jgi:cysteine-rich repeat protein